MDGTGPGRGKMTASSAAPPPAPSSEHPDDAPLRAVVRSRAFRFADSPALLAPGVPALSYAAMNAQLEAGVAALRGWGITPDHRIAVSMPDGPAAAITVLTVMNACAAAPLNPACRETEVERLLASLEAEAIVVPDEDALAAKVAGRLGLAVFVATPGARMAGAVSYSLTRGPVRAAGRSAPGAPALRDALLLHTSGVTSQPKLVPLTHANVAAATSAIAAALALSGSDRTLIVMPLFHIHGLSALFASLWSGGSVVCPEGGFQAPQVFSHLAEFGATWYTAAPTIHRAILERSSRHSAELARHCLRFVRSASAAMSPVVIGAIEERLGVPFIEAYGMTEAAPQIASTPLPPRERIRGSVGVPAGCEVAILEEDGTPVPTGEVGEIAVRGPNVTRGYERNPSANADAFVHGWFRTGDLGCLDADGYLFITGRKKDLINRGGEKIAPREIEEVLLEHPAVAEAVVFGYADDRLGEDVGAAVVLGTDPVSERELREHVAAILADFKVPRRIAIVAGIPEGPTAKVSRSDMPRLLGFASTTAELQPYEPPRTDTERQVAVLWQDVLRVDLVGRADDFIALGGDSILALQLLARIRRTCGVELRPIAMYDDCSTVTGMALAIDAARASSRSTTSDVVTCVPREGELPLSFAQELVWSLDQGSPQLAAYNQPRALRLTGPVDGDALQRALDHVVARHEVLRTVYRSGDHGPVQRPLQAGLVPLEVLDLRAVPAERRTAKLNRALQTWARTPFDLSRDLVLRAHLVRERDDQWILLLVSHHIATDAWSRGLVLRDLEAAYRTFIRGELPRSTAGTLQYADFAAWQRAPARAQEIERDVAWWHEQLRDPPEPPQLPADFPRPLHPAFEGALHLDVIPVSLVSEAKRVGRAHGATLYVTLLAALQTTLHRYCGGLDIITGSPFPGRYRPELDGVVGCFINTLPLRTTFAGSPTFVELITRLRRTVAEAREHEAVPFVRLADRPLFNCVLTMEDALPPSGTFGPATAAPLDFDFGQAKFDLTLMVAERPEGLRCSLWYRTDLFRPETAARILDHFQCVLEQVTRNPHAPVGEVELLTEEERRQLDAWNDTGAPESPGPSVVELFEHRAKCTPEQAAVVDGRSTVRYAELDDRANQLAHYLCSLGVGPGDPVALVMERSADAIVGLLGILKTGTAYVPLSPEMPPARCVRHLVDAGARVVVTLAAHANGFEQNETLTVVALDRDAERIAAMPRLRPNRTVSPRSLAYILYTSGSTGEPKGVGISHANITHYTHAIARVLGGSLEALGGWRFGMVSTLGADLGNTALYPSLCGGGTLWLADSAAVREPARFAAMMREHRMDVLKMTPGHFAALTAGAEGDALRELLPARWLVLGGEALPLELARTLVAARSCRVLNHYGPTETTVGVCTWEATEESLLEAEGLGARTSPIGRPLPSTRAWVVDARGIEQPVGVPGELWIGGPGVAEGYRHRPEQTEERFGYRKGVRFYRTGDRVRRLADGTLEFLGRLDEQVKIRGYRVEPGEIEALLLQHPGVSRAFVLLRNDQLAAYVASGGGYAAAHAQPTSHGLLLWLREQLPPHMVPASVTILPDLPLTANGKVDRLRLPDPAPLPSGTDRFVAPRTDTERTVATIWSEVLKRDGIGVTDSFLDLGGHSLLAIRVLGRISKQLGVRLPLRSLFDAPTVAQLAERVDEERRQAAERALEHWLSVVEQQGAPTDPEV